MEEVNGIQIYKNGEKAEFMKHLEVAGKKLVFPYGVRITEENGTVTLTGMTIEENTALRKRANIAPDVMFKCWTGPNCFVSSCFGGCAGAYNPSTGEYTCYCPNPPPQS